MHLKYKNISQSSSKTAAHICVIDTNEDDSRCAAPHGKVSLLHISVRRYTNVCRFAAGLPACGSEDTRSSSSSALNTLQSFGLFWLVTTVIASHSCCHFFPPVAHCLPSVNALSRHSRPLALTNLVI